MKFLVFGIALLFAGASAFPEKVQISNRSVGSEFADNFRRLIETIRKLIIDNRFDPWVVARHDSEIVYQPYVNLQYFVQNLEFSGASNIVIHTLEYSELFSRFDFDLELPQIALSIERSGATGMLLSNAFDASFYGTLKISGLRLSGAAHATYDLVTKKITITSLDAKFSLGGTESDLHVIILTEDYSERVNNFINKRIPDWLALNETDLNRVISSVIRVVAQFYFDYIRGLFD